jgi:murein DD-endopeptidase MepM/ murein hydrolase activator NlpD
LIFIFSSHLAVAALSADVTSPFGWRTSPITGDFKFHTGIDIAAEYGEGIPAAYSGMVVHAGWYDGYGNTVILDNGNSLYTLYGHCSQIYVSVGQSVEQGQIIAAAGSTGDSTGPHIHLSVWMNNEYLDPMTVFHQ